MTTLDTGTYGAKVQSWRKANPRDLLRRLIEERPKAGRDDLLKAFRSQIRDEESEDFLDSIIEYWFANNYHSLTERPSAATDMAEKRVQVEAIKATIKKRAATMVLLDTLLPNGKLLRNSTFGECADMGGVLSTIAGKGKPGEIVGKVLSDNQLRKLQGS